MKPRYRKVKGSEWSQVIGQRIDWPQFDLKMRQRKYKDGFLRMFVGSKDAVMRVKDDVWFVKVAK